MSDLYKKSFRGYLIDHHSPDPPIVTLENLDMDEYEDFFLEACINNLMVYCKDHWGVTYYNSKVGKRHPGLKEDWVAKLKPILIKHHIEFNAYYCLEYDNHACISHPEWRILKADGSPLTCAFEPAPWKMACYETGYRAYILEQIHEIIEGYRPDSLFLDIFGKSLCYCDVCRTQFQEAYGYPLPEDEVGLIKHRIDVVESLDQSAKRMLKEIREVVSRIDSEVKITFNFAALYDKDIRDQLDYQFTEPWAGNWLSAAYSRDTAPNQFPQLGPGDVSLVYNYQPESIYELAAAQITAQGCRVFMYSGSQHPDGTLEHVEAKRIGKAYKEVAKYEHYLSDRELIADIGIIQSDVSSNLRKSDSFPASAITRVRESGGHKDALLGAMKLCDYSNYTWQILPEQTLNLEKMTQYQMLILPAVYHVSERLKVDLENYVKEGGQLIADGQCGLYDLQGQTQKNYTLKSLFACDYISVHEHYKKSEWSGYLKAIDPILWQYLPATTPPIGSKRYKVKTMGDQAEVFAFFVDPATEITKDQWVNWWCPPPSRLTSEAAVIGNKYGKGQTLFMAFDFFELENKDFKWPKDMMRGIADKYIKQPQIRLESRFPNTIGFTAYKKTNKEEWVVHLISNMAEKAQGDCPEIEAGQLQVRVTDGREIVAKSVYPHEAKLKVNRVDEQWCIKIPKVKIHSIIVIEFK